MKGRGLTVPEYLDEIFLRYGFYLEGVINIYYEGASGSESTRHKLPDAPTETARRSLQSEAAPPLSDRRRDDKEACSTGGNSSGRDDVASRASCCAPLGCNRYNSSLLTVVSRDLPWCLMRSSSASLPAANAPSTGTCFTAGFVGSIT